MLFKELMRKAHNNLSYIAEYLSARIWITIALRLFRTINAGAAHAVVENLTS